MYIVHLSNPTRQIRLDANRMYIDEGFITFQIQRGPGEDDPLRVASFRAEDVTAVYDQEYIQSVIDLPNIGSGSRIPFETTQRVEPSADYAPAIIRRGSTATEARQYPPALSDTPAPFVASWEQEGTVETNRAVSSRFPQLMLSEDNVPSLRYHNGTYEDPLGMRPLPESDYPDPVNVAYPSDPEPEVLNRAGQPVSFADRISRNSLMPTRLPPAPPVATREPFRVSTENMMASTSGPRLYVTADEMISSAREQAMAAGENF